MTAPTCGGLLASVAARFQHPCLCAVGARLRAEEPCERGHADLIGPTDQGLVNLEIYGLATFDEGSEYPKIGGIRDKTPECVLEMLSISGAPSGSVSKSSARTTDRSMAPTSPTSNGKATTYLSLNSHHYGNNNGV